MPKPDEELGHSLAAPRSSVVDLDVDVAWRCVC